MATKKEITKSEPTTAIVTAATRELTPGIWAMIEKMAPAMYRSRLFGVTSVEQAAAIMLKGYELGLSMTASFELVQVIQGKPALSPRGAMAILLNNPTIEEITIKRIDEKGAFIGYECTMSRNTGFAYTARFTMDDAKRAGLVKPDSGWSKYPENMCLWRAVGFAADVVAPDITAGMTTLMKAPEMYGVALTADGDIVDALPVTVPTTDPLQELVNQFGAEAVMQANEGRIPVNGEVEEVRRKLETANANVSG
jgi:hypothetical protein